MNRIFFVFVFILLCACTSNDKNVPSAVDSKTASKETKLTSGSESSEMVKLLKRLSVKGNPMMYYHWNQKRADLYKNQYSRANGNQKMMFWYKYCSELLNAGKNRECITEIEQFLLDKNLKYKNFISKKTLPVIELLGLAYLRLGEIDNCRKNHNEFSCILPLDPKAYHTERLGSSKAIEIFSLIYEKFPTEKYQWLLNVAHMTLGDYPDNVPEEYLIHYPNWEKEKKEFPRFKEIATGIGIAENALSGGVCLDDFNKDGLIDIFATSYGMSDQCKLFINTGSGFSDKTAESGLTGIVSGLNCIHADYDNDGNKDILVLRGAWLGNGGKHPNSLLKNNGDGTFTDVTKSSGLLSYYPTQTASWADVNKDGYLDLFIGNESKGKQANYCELFINQKDGTFKEQADAFNLSKIKGFIKGVAFGDINNDQWPDLYISVLGGENLLFKNEAGKFKEIAKVAGVNNPNYSFPCWFWDVNNDGLNDIFVSAYDLKDLNSLSGDFAKELQGKPVEANKSKLYINNGDETFSEQSVAYNVDISLYAMGANYGDLDNDGWLDFYIGTGAPDFSTIIPNRMFQNKEGKTFEEVTSAGGFGHIQKGHGIGFADFDNDGDQDIYAVMGGAYEGDKFTNVYFENPISKNNWVVLDLEGTTSNRNAIGTRIKLELNNGRTIYRTIGTGGSFGANSLQAEIGLGKAKSIKQITVYWSNSNAQIIHNLVVNKKYKITEGQKELVEKKYSSFKMHMKDGMHHHH